MKNMQFVSFLVNLLRYKRDRQRCRTMIDHIGLAIADFERSKKFYSLCLAPLEMELIAEVEGWVGYGRNGKADFWFGPDASAQLPMHIAFSARNRSAVDRFYQAALAAGGGDNGAPGIRKSYHPDYYGAFVIDPDGHNIEAVCHQAEMTGDDYRIETGYLPGLVGRVAEMHADYYSRHWKFTHFFETRVACEMSEFINRYDADRDRSWSALIDGNIVASISVDGIDAAGKGAHLRWFIAAEAARGRGIGGRLINLALDFCRQRQYKRIYLHTFEGLEAAQRLYESAGFRLVETESGEQWGTRVEEQRYEARL